MASSLLIIVDPEGDLILDVGEAFLSKQRQDAVPPTADWETSASPSADQTANQREEPTNQDAEDSRRSNRPIDAELSLKTHYRKEPDVVLSSMDKSRRILVCAKVMTWASSTFRSQLNGPWKDGREEAKRDGQGRMNIKYPEDDPAAMLFLCKFLHHRPGTSLILDYNSLHNLAVVTDKYDCYDTLQVWFRSQWQTRLQIGRKDFLPGFPHNTCGYALQVMRMAYRLHDPTWFALASTLYAYTQRTNSIASTLRAPQIKDGIELLEELIAPVFALQQDLMRNFEALPTKAMKTILKDSAGRSPRGTHNGGRRPDDLRLSLCNGIIAQFGHASVTLAQADLLPNTATPSSVQEFVRRLNENIERLTSTSVPAGNSVCSTRSCPDCRGISRPDIRTILLRELRNAYTIMLTLDGICLNCIKEGRPFDGYETRPCKIHGFWSSH